MSPQQILTTMMMCIIVDKSTDHAKPHSICFLPQYQRIFIKICWQLKTLTQDLKVHALHYANEWLVLVSLYFQKLLQHAETIQKNVWEKSNDSYSLLIRVQTTKSHILICFNHKINVKENDFSERELKKALCNTLTRVVWYGLLLANQIARLTAIVVKIYFDPLFQRLINC